jgi:uncharacterized protein (TIGR02147 family)
MASPGISIFGYFNYRQYLRDYFSHRKSANPRFSHRAFARKAGYNSSGLYLLLVSGKQNMTRALLPKFARALDLSPRESEYLGHLADFTHGKTASEKQAAFDRMIGLLPPSARNIGREQRDYYAQWQHVAVRESLSVLDVGDDYRMLAGFLRPPLKTRQAKDAIHLLADLGLIRKNADGFWKATDASLASTPELGAVTIHRFQKEMMELGKAALERFDRTERNIASSTLSLSKLGFERLSSKLDGFLKEIAELARSDENEDCVYQLNLQLFPLTGKKPE